MTQHKLLIETELDLPIITEFAALCVEGWVYGGKICGAVLEYKLNELPEQYQISIRTDSIAQNTDDAGEELLDLISGLFSLGTRLSAAGELFHKHEKLKDALAWKSRTSADTPSLESRVHAQSHLTLGDLLEINHFLNDQTEPIADLQQHAGFKRCFPLVDLYCGSYGNIRHRSGNEIYMEWIDNKFPGRHKIDAANPGAEAYKQFACQRSGKTYRRPNASFKESGPCRKSVLNRRKLAYMLGCVPDEHKERVYAWVVDVLNTVDYYHDTRGSVPLPELFSIDFAGCKMTATHDLVFRLEAEER